MEYYNLDESIQDVIKSKSTDFKARMYCEIFHTLCNMNMTPEITVKVDLSYLEKELMEVLLYLNDDDVITNLDIKMKEVILEALNQNGIKLSEDIPIYILNDILEQYVLLFNTDPSLTNDLLNIVDGYIESNQPTFTFVKLINYYSSTDIATLCNYIESVDLDVLEKLRIKYEENDQDGYSDRSNIDNIQNIAIFNVRYQTGLMNSRNILSEIKKNQLFNRPFEHIFPYINRELNGENIGKEEYIDTLIIGYLASKEGYNDVDNIINTLNDFGLIQDFDSIHKDVITLEIKNKLKSFRK